MIYIDDKSYHIKESQTIMDVAYENDIFIPGLCYGENLPPTGACGLCVVECEDNKKLIRACATPATDGIKVYTKTQKVIEVRKQLLELTLSTHKGDCKPPCQLACPAESNCQGYISLIKADKLQEAIMLLKETHPFPLSIAMICPRPCEKECRRQLVDSPVNIAGLKQFIAETDLKSASPYIPEISLDKKTENTLKNHQILMYPSHLQGKDYEERTENILSLVTSNKTSASVSIIGGGPAGLTAAFFLRKAGFEVKVYDKMPKMGGLLRYGIPEYRLPKATLDAELDILKKMGIEFINNMKAENHAKGNKSTLELLRKTNNAVIIAIGAGASKPLGCKGENARGVLGGIDFLKAVACNRPIRLGKRVVVIGGSNTAMDVARTAIRLGAKQVIVAYRRSKEEMPASMHEILAAFTEGVEFMYLVAPLKITEEKGYVTGIALDEMRLGEPDSSGRKTPIPTGITKHVRANTIITAVGQDVIIEGLEPLDDLSIDNEFRTKFPDVYVIGDATGKTSYAIEAIAQGRKVANIIIENVLKEESKQPTFLPKVLVSDTTKTEKDFSHVNKVRRGEEFSLEPSDNMLGFLAYHGVLDELRPTIKESFPQLIANKAKEEADRCLSCGCASYDKCKLINLANMYNANPKAFSVPLHRKPNSSQDTRHATIKRDTGKCTLCGLCVKVCDREGHEVFSAINRGFETTIDTAFNEALPEKCSTCGKCVKHCPVGALYEYSCFT